MKRVWCELDALGIHLEPDAWDFELLGLGDSLLMDLFIEALAPQEDMKWLNWCRMFLNVVTVSEIVTADGTHITHEAWSGHKSSCRRTPFQWPRTSRPTAPHWDKWRHWLQKVLLTPNGTDRHLRQPLGPWTDDIHAWNWLYSPSQDQLFYRDGHGWASSSPSESSLRFSSRTFTFHRSATPFSLWRQAPLPTDVQRATVDHTSSSDPLVRFAVQVSGIGDQLSEPEELDRPPSLLSAWEMAAQQIVGSFGWVPEKIEVQGSEEVLFEALRDNSLRIISDGSYKNHIGTAVVQLRPTKPGNVVWVYCRTPGKRADQSAYRSELIGLLAGVMVATWLYREWDPGGESRPLVNIACDGLSALRNSFANNNVSPSQPQFDLVSSLQAAIKVSGIHWCPLHVKGHADRDREWDKLTWWEQRNVEVDQRAATLHDEIELDGIMPTQNPRFFSEPCAIFVRGDKLSSLVRDILDNLVVLPQLEADWVSQARLSRDAVQLVDWSVTQRAMKALPAGIQRWCTKHVSGMCGVGKFRLLWGLDQENKCPLCGHKEDHCHVPRCADARALQEWNSRVEEFRMWLEVNSTAPFIINSLLSLLARIREPRSPLWQGWQHLPSPLHHSVLSAQTSQDIIGPQGLLEGLLSSEWAEVQQAHFAALGNRRSGLKWASLVSQQLIMIGFHMWMHRNSVQHSDESVQNRALARTTDLGIRRQFAKGDRDLPPNARRQLRLPVKEVLALPLPQWIRWLNWIKLEREQVERLLRARRRMLYDFAHTDQSRIRQIRRTRRVFKQTVRVKQRQFRQRCLGFTVRSEGQSVTP